MLFFLIRYFNMVSSTHNFAGLMKAFAKEVHTDVLGNIIAHKPGKGQRIMLVAHHDVVRLMITYVDGNGFLYVKPAGGIDVSILPARKVVIRHSDKKVPGIIGKRPMHLMKEESCAKVTYDSLWIDIGAKNKEEALGMVSIGDYAYYDTEYEEFPNDIITGAYLDDHAGLDVLMNLAKGLANAVIPWDVYYVASNHEEIGMRGACVAAHTIKPDVCICIDVTHATDYPTMTPASDGDIKLGEGCVLAKGPNISPALQRSIEDMAILNNIQYQIEVSPYPTGTDANVIQLSGDGVETAVISIPCRYMHTPYEVCSKKDIESAINILYGFMYEGKYDEK